jgi:hypothetical protein
MMLASTVEPWPVPADCVDESERRRDEKPIQQH